MLYWYHVCNDYTLEKTETPSVDVRGLEVIELETGVAYHDQGEVIYFCSIHNGLDNCSIEYEILEEFP